ncbi:iron chelate uptake ABC transporter family permease subunit [Stenoxybacter acetivorans]|uniref:iron chelate uptake ABC transporter family permease subunit n=1 Tax=Stenoxybacter acetivorans TaxID=422441 RepID=UPI00055E898E|nr:iron chelate uptake ABC transporter family permease subunit [Stenoxybacter acetivorans]
MRIPIQLNIINLLLLLFLITTSIVVGVADFDWKNLWQSPKSLELLFISRLPRTAAVILTGAALAVAGMVLQIVMKNRFIAPDMVGAGQSAALGILLMSLFFPAAAPWAKTGVAALAALLGMGLFLLMLRRLPLRQQLLLPLVGLVYGNIIESAVTFIAYETESAQMLAVWFAGDFSAVLAGRYEWLWLTGALALLAYLLADRLTIAGLGRDISIGLGVNYTQMLWLSLMVVAVITSVVVVTVGQIPFIGLVVPNIVTRLAGDRLRHNLPSVALMGANLLLLCDVLGRVLNAPYEIPVSVLFGVLGTGAFLYLLFRKDAAHAA